MARTPMSHYRIKSIQKLFLIDEAVVRCSLFLVPFQALNWGLSFVGPCSVVALSDSIDPKIKD